MIINYACELDLIKYAIRGGLLPVIYILLIMRERDQLEDIINDIDGLIRKYN